MPDDSTVRDECTEIRAAFVVPAALPGVRVVDSGLKDGVELVRSWAEDVKAVVVKPSDMMLVVSN